MKLPEISVRRPVSMLMVFCAAIIVGGVCLSQMPIDLFPKMDLPAITVITQYKGAAPEDVESKVTKVLESNLSTVPELKHITSTSKEEISTITLTFEWGTDLDTRANEVRDMVGLSKILLPDDVDEPRVVKINIGMFPILVYGVTAEESYPKLEKILKDEIGDPVKRLSGVATSTVMVPLVRQINVDLDRERLAAHNLTPLDVARVIGRENANTPAGNVRTGLADYVVRVPGEFTEVEPMKSIVLSASGGSIVRLLDVGEVSDGFAEISQHIKINGKSAAIITVQKQSGANTVEVARAVRAALPKLMKRLPADVRIVPIMDSSEDIERTVNDLTEALVIAGVMTMLMVVLFLRKWRATLVIGLTIPFSLILALIFGYFLGYTINMITMFALIVAIGMVVDDAIVILEVITRHREAGERPNEGAMYGASEVAMAVISSTATTICVFFPILFVKGIMRILLTDFAVTMAVAMLGSLFSALTLTPMLSSTLMRKEKFGEDAEPGPFFRFTERAFTALYEFYGRVLAWALGHRWTVIGGAVLVLAAMLPLAAFVGSDFMPQEDRNMFSGTLYLPVGTRIEETSRVMDEVGRIITETIPQDERIAVYTVCGTSPGGAGRMGGDEGAHIGTFGVKLVTRNQRGRSVFEIGADLRKRMDAARGVLQLEKYRLDMGDPMSSMMQGGEQPLTINIIGDDLDATDKLAIQIRDIAKATPGAKDVNISRVKGVPELWVRVDRDKASTLGLNVSDVGDVVRASIYGNTASKFRVMGDEYDVLVRVRESDRDDPRDILAVPVRLSPGTLIRAENVATLTEERGPLSIDRKDRGRVVNVTGSVESRSLGEIAKDIRAGIARLDIPRGVDVVFAGQVSEQEESSFWMYIAMAVGICLVYMVMASQFESLRDPFIVMFSVPFGFAGAIAALFLGGQHINVVVFLGMLLLIGIVVKNAILLVDYTNVLRRRGVPLAEAVPLAGKTRLRPVLMTALATMGGLAPLAFGKGQGAEIWNPLGITVLGGLVVSTFVTLVLVPTIYSMFESRLKTSEKPWREQS